MSDQPTQAEPLEPTKWTRQTYRAALDYLAEVGDEYCGLPMPVSGIGMIIHPKYRYADILKRKQEPDPEDDEYELINAWHSMRWQSEIYLMRHKPSGRITHGKIGGIHHAAMMIHTFGVCSSAHSIETEGVAIEKLGTLLKPHLFQMYLMTGAFLETSKRSHVTYVFRRLRPTLALKQNAGEPDAKILCALCLHPIGYYEGTWAGAMVPTDEVIAHLMLMRGDEHEFWKQSNQHPSWSPNAGI